jgi:hypothetical protein
MRVHDRGIRLLVLALVLVCAACEGALVDVPAEKGEVSAEAASPRLATNVETVCEGTIWPWGRWVLSIVPAAGCPNNRGYLIGSPSPAGEIICGLPLNSDIPPGFVISYYPSSRGCPGYSPTALNAWLIKHPAQNESVCSVSPIPDGWVEIRYGGRKRCPAHPTGYPGMMIKIPGQMESVCTESPIPNGYVYLYYGRAQYCPYYAPQGSFNVIRIMRPTAGTLVNVCLSSPVPAGWVRKSYGWSASCPSAPGGFNTNKIKVPVAGEVACYPQTLPAGWRFVSHTRRSSACPNYSPTGAYNVGVLGTT